MTQTQVFDLEDKLKSQRKEPEFIPIEVPEFEDYADAHAELNEAEQTLFKYKQMIDHVKRADEITDSITCGHVQFDHMTEYDEMPIYEDSTLDVLSVMVKHLRSQIAKFQQYCSDLEAECEALEEQERNDATYGTEREQVMSYFYSTR